MKTKFAKLNKKAILTRIVAALAASFLPAATYTVVHYQAPVNPMYWILALAGLAYSAPTVAKWAQGWAHSPYKAWAFTVLTEGMLSFGLPAMSITALVILVGINALCATYAGPKPKKAAIRRKASLRVVEAESAAA